MNNTLRTIKNEIYDACGFQFSAFELEIESSDYDACRFKLNNLKVVSRTAKVTPKKTGQFVTFWKRNKLGIIEPLNQSDGIDFYVIQVKTEHQLGQFVFPMAALVNYGIVSSNKKEGKRGFRVYPPWNKAVNKQAVKTQKWQLNYFYELTAPTDLNRVIELYKND